MYLGGEAVDLGKDTAYSALLPLVYRLFFLLDTPGCWEQIPFQVNKVVNSSGKMQKSAG
jgi:hypothetical protein